MALCASDRCGDLRALAAGGVAVQLRYLAGRHTFIKAWPWCSAMLEVMWPLVFSAVLVLKAWLWVLATSAVSCVPWRLAAWPFDCGTWREGLLSLELGSGRALQGLMVMCRFPACLG